MGSRIVNLAGLIFAAACEGIFIKSHDWGWVAFGGFTLLLFALRNWFYTND